MKKLLPSLFLAALLLTGLQATAQNFNLQSRATLDYPGQTLANIYGYVQDGREYALVGGSQGLIIVDVTDPDSPVNLVQIPGPDNLWKEIKVYGHYAYVTSEGGQGLQIVDLSPLPATNLPYHFYTGDGAIAGQLNTIHALHIDLTRGFVYLHGSNLANGGPVILDLNNDPYNPTYAGQYDQLGYVHDGFVENDTLYAGHIYDGLMAIVDVTDKQNPMVLGSVQTPGKFTHNTWPLDDHQTVLTTDESTPSFVTSYDVSDPTDIKELDRISPNDGNNSIGHNTHVRNDWAITSWYTDGVVIIDAHKPDNLVITGIYDTYPQGEGPDFDGCWGAFPFFPSGTIVTSNINPARLTVLTPTYVRAAYLEGVVKNGCTGLPMSGVSITVNSNDPYVNTTTGNDGSFKTGQAATGSFAVTFSKPGFLPTTMNVNLVAGEVTLLDVTLDAGVTYTVNATVVNENNAVLANTTISIANASQTYSVQTNASGQFNLDCVTAGEYAVGAWGFLPGILTVNANGAVTLALTAAYYDDFQLDLGWNTSSTASTGDWVLGDPIGTTGNNELVNPENDAAGDDNANAYMTGNGGGGAGDDDVDGGTVTLSTPPMLLAGYDDAILTFSYWFYNGGGSGTPNDNLTVQVSNGQQTVTVLVVTESQSAWRQSDEIHLAGLLPLTDNMTVQFIAIDQQPGHLSESAVDLFQVITVEASGTSGIDQQAVVNVLPNPSSTDFTLQYAWPNVADAQLDVRNLLGQTVLTQALSGSAGTARFGSDWPRGAYLITLRSADGRQSLPVKVVKQ